MIGQVPISGTLNPLLTNSQYNLYSLWNTVANSITVTGLTGMSTLKVTFTDATGLIYTSTVKIQPAK